MSLVCTNLDSGSSQVVGSVTTNSYTPGKNNLILFTIWEVDNTPGTISGISGNGITWTQVATANIPTQTRITTWAGINSNPSVGAITVTFTGDASPNRLWITDQISGIDFLNNNGVVQHATNTANGTTTGLTVTLAAFASALNGTYGVVGHDSVNTISPGGSFTTVKSLAALSRTMLSQFVANNQTSVPWTWASVSGDTEGVALEIKQLIAGGGFLQHFM